MCGILSVFYKSGVIVGKDSIRTMLNEMSHRGKDQSEVCSYRQCDVGFVRLAITNISSQQPGRYGQVDVFLNGEIYNYKELGFTGGECDVLAQGFDKYGPRFVDRLNGHFSILLVRGDDVYVFRDRYGTKPLYWWEDDDVIIVSSEIKPILKYPGYNFGINEKVKRQWLVFNNCFTNETLFTGIHRIEKGTYTHINSGATTKFWSWNFNEEHHQDYGEAKSEIRRLIELSVKRQTPSEVSFGSCLSSGIDSNVVVSLLSNDCHTFTAGFSGEGIISDESSIAAKYGKKHYDVVFNGIRNFRETIYAVEDLRVGASWSNYGLYELASKFVKVLLCGGGSDELFLGYSWRYNPKIEYYNIVNRTGIEDPYCKDLFETIYPVDNIKERQIFDANHFLEGVLLVTDRLSMRHTIELRCPFLDNDLVDFVTTLPVEFRHGKRILKDAFSDLLPKEVLNGKKMGWSSPDWFPKVGNQALNWATSAINCWEELFDDK